MPEHGCCLGLPSVELPVLGSGSGSGLVFSLGSGLTSRFTVEGSGIRGGDQGYALGHVSQGWGLGLKSGPTLDQVEGSRQRPAAAPPGPVSIAQSSTTFRKIWGDEAGRSEPGDTGEGGGLESHHPSYTGGPQASRRAPESPGFCGCPDSTLGHPAVNRQTPLHPSKHHLLQAALLLAPPHLPQEPHLLQAGVGDRSTSQ